MTRFTGEFPSQESFIGSLPATTLHTGDNLRTALIHAGTVYPDLLILPSARVIAEQMGASGASELNSMGRRVGIKGIQAVLEAATGLPVIPVNGFAVDLSAQARPPEEKPPIVFGGVDPVTVTDVAAPEQAAQLANTILDRSTPVEALRFAQQLLGYVAAAIESDSVE